MSKADVAKSTKGMSESSEKTVKHHLHEDKDYLLNKPLIFVE